MTKRITNTSPLILLAKLDRLDLLRLGVDKVLVPSAVFKEIGAKGDVATKRVEAYRGVWLEECKVTRPELARLLPDLGEGEVEVIVQAMQENIVDVCLDDQDARRIARRVGLQPIGTVGLLIAAKKRGLIPSLRAELDKLRAFGFWASERLVEQALREAGES